MYLKIAHTHSLIYKREITITLVYMYKTYSLGILQNKRELVEVYQKSMIYYLNRHNKEEKFQLINHISYKILYMDKLLLYYLLDLRYKNHIGYE